MVVLGNECVMTLTSSSYIWSENVEIETVFAHVEPVHVDIQMLTRLRTNWFVIKCSMIMRSPCRFFTRRLSEQKLF